MFNQKTLTHLRWACRGIVAGTGAFSVWANILHITVFSWPSLIFAAAPPLIVIFSFEMNSRIPLREAKWYSPRRWIRPMVTGAISFGGAWLSYWHQKAAILRYNSGDEQNAAILPLLVDGFMIIASVCVYELNARIIALELKNAGRDLAKAAKATEVSEPVKTERVNRRELIAAAVIEAPWASAKEIAAILSTRGVTVKETYVANVMSELRKAQRTNGAPATVTN